MPTNARRRVPVRVIAAAVGAILVIGNVLLVLGPVLGLVGAAASTAPIVAIPVGQIVVAIAVGYLVAIGCVVLALVSRKAWLSWTFVVSAWIASLIGSIWPIVVTANAAVDRAGDIVPFITELIRSFGG